jgi:hypothetical protein
VAAVTPEWRSVYVVASVLELPVLDRQPAVLQCVGYRQSAE